MTISDVRPGVFVLFTFSNLNMYKKESNIILVRYLFIVFVSSY